jgi:hypothetical protein
MWNHYGTQRDGGFGVEFVWDTLFGTAIATATLRSPPSLIFGRRQFEQCYQLSRRNLANGNDGDKGAIGISSRPNQTHARYGPPLEGIASPDCPTDVSASLLQEQGTRPNLLLVSFGSDDQSSPTAATAHLLAGDAI